MFRILRLGLRWIIGLFMIVGLVFAIEMVTAFVVTVSEAKNVKSPPEGRLPENRLSESEINFEIPLQG